MDIRMRELLNHLAKELHTAVRILDRNCELVEELMPEDFDFDRSLEDFGLLSRAPRTGFLESLDPTPTLFVINRSFFYAVVRGRSEAYTFGPLICTTRFTCLHELQVRLSDTQKEKILSLLRPIQFSRVIELLCLFCNLTGGEEEEPVTEQAVTAANQVRNVFTEEVLSEVTSTVFANVERNSRHNPYDEEIREMAAVERGDTEILRRIVEETYTGNVGVLSDDLLRHTKNLAIVIITLASRAAIRGGVPYEVSFSMSDRFIREIEKKESVTEVDEYSRTAEFQYAETVREYQGAIRTMKSGRENEHVERTKDYIFRNLHGRIRIPEIAKALALNSNYLSTIFRKCEGITITEYILRQKLLLVRNLLIYSDYTYLEITNYLGFPSQSYLGKKFKEETGMTLREYRTRYRVRGFSEEKQAAGTD